MILLARHAPPPVGSSGLRIAPDILDYRTQVREWLQERCQCADLRQYLELRDARRIHDGAGADIPFLVSDLDTQPDAARHPRRGRHAVHHLRGKLTLRGEDRPGVDTQPIIDVFQRQLVISAKSEQVFGRSVSTQREG